jgi:hypothetical protein
MMLRAFISNTYIETMRALSATGDYDLSSKDEVAQLQKDAKFKARILTAFRACITVHWPYRRNYQSSKFQPLKATSLFLCLIKEFYDMQADPAIGYDKALPQFLAKYGDESSFVCVVKEPRNC